MPITKVITGDLIEEFKQGRINILIHGANCHHKMGAGIAKQIAAAYPEALRADIENSEYGDVSKLGNCTLAFIERPEGDYGIIMNAYTQYHPGREDETSLYQNIHDVFTRIDSFYLAQVQSGAWKRNSMVIGIPKIGAGIAGGDWERIQRIINSTTPNLSITLVNWDK